jgi:site-specific recombinase XerD
VKSVLSTDKAAYLFAPLCLTDAAAVAGRNAGGIKDVADSTLVWWSEAARNLSRFLADGAPVAVDEITPDHILEWRAWQLDCGLSAVTANNRLRALRIVYNRLLKMNLVADNPAAHVLYAPQKPHSPQACKISTYCRLRTVAGVREQAILALLWGTGCRIGELPSMTLDTLEIWQENGRFRLAVVAVGKYQRRRSIEKATRYVYADGREVEDVRRWLEERRATGRYLFPDKSGKEATTSNTLHSIFHHLRLAAGIDPRKVVSNPHSFRHAFAYRKRRQGYPIEWISQWLGHSDPMFTAKMYGDKSEPEIRRRFFEPPPGSG